MYHKLFISILCFVIFGASCPVSYTPTWLLALYSLTGGKPGPEGAALHKAVNIVFHEVYMSLVKSYFLAKVACFRFPNILEEKCDDIVDIFNGIAKFNLYVDKFCKNLSLGRAIFPTKVFSFQVCWNLRRKLCCRHQ